MALPGRRSMSRATMASTSPSLRAPSADRGSVPRCRLAPTCSIICFSSSAREARAPTSPPRQRRSCSSCSRMTTRRRPSFVLPLRNAQRPSTSSTARRSLPSIPMLHRSCPNRRNRRALCGRSCSQRSSLRPRKRSAPSRSMRCSQAARMRGSRFPWRRRWRKRAADLRKTRRAQTSPRQACASRPSPATIKLPGT